VQRDPVGTVLFNQGESPDFLYIALEGSFELVATAGGGEETVVEISSAPNTYTMAAVLTNAPYLVSGRVIQQARVLMIDAEDLCRCVVSYPRLGRNLLGALSWQFRTMVRQVINLKTKSTAQRLGCYLLLLAQNVGDGEEIELPYSKRSLAARLGMTTVSLSRAYKTLSEYGVQPHRNRVRITDTAKLRAFSQPDHGINEAERELRFRTEDQDDENICGSSHKESDASDRP
jgi:CRP/FNR family transcriptional activator FtrB